MNSSERGADMSLIGLILTLVVVGVVLWLLQSFGVLGSLRDLRIR